MLHLIASLPLLAPTGELDFLEDVYPIFEARCLECHGPKKQKGKLRLDRRDGGAFSGDPEYSPVVAGDPEASVLYELITLPADDPDVMPGKGDPLTAEQIETLRTWIAEGAAWEDPPPAEPEETQVDPLTLPPLSEAQVAARDAARAALEERGLRPLRVAQGLEAMELNASLLREKAGDEEARRVEGLAPVLVWANFSGTAITDAGLAHLGRCLELRRLNVSRTKVTDAGLEHLSGLAKLHYLNLYGTGITDAGLAHLHGLKELRKLYLWRTEVSDEGVERLIAAHPGIEVNRGASPPPAPTGPINAKCPVTGKDVDPACTSEYQGHRIAFCCGMCKAQFDADPAAFVEKIPELPREGAGVPLNEKCPVSGQPVDPAHTSEYEGRTVAFCCAKCKAAFDAAPEKYADALGDGK